MGDIAFLLIIFFILAATPIRDAGIQLTPPVSMDIDDVEDTLLRVTIDEEGLIYVRGEEVGDAEAVEYAISALIPEEPTEQQRRVVFRCDRNIPKEVFEPVLEAIVGGGGIVAAVGEQVGGEP